MATRCLAALAILGLAKASPSPSAIEKAYVLKITDQDKCIGATNSNSTQLVVADCTGDDAQLWTFTGASNKQWKNVMTSSCLTIDKFVTNSTGTMLEKCKSKNVAQQFLDPSQAFINTKIDACVGPCSEASTEVCGFKDDAEPWCDTCGGLTQFNKKVSTVLYCGLEKGRGKWVAVNATKCSKTCDCGMLDVTYECQPRVGGYQNACCPMADKPPKMKLCNAIPCGMYGSSH